MIYALDIPGKLPTLNEYSDAERACRYKGSGLKRRTQAGIRALCAGAPRFDGHVYVGFAWVRPDRRCDKDNVAFAKKFVLDALQEAGVIKRDSWNLCTPYDHSFRVNPNNPRTVVVVGDDPEEVRKELAERV